MLNPFQTIPSKEPAMQPYITRRTQLLQKIGPDGLAVLFAAPEQRRSNDTAFPFRPDSYFHYLSGLPEP